MRQHPFGECRGGICLPVNDDHIYHTPDLKKSKPCKGFIQTSQEGMEEKQGTCMQKKGGK